MKEIPLTQGKVALVDDADYEWAAQFKWQATVCRREPGDIWYATRGVWKNRRVVTLRLHREIAKRAGLPASPRYDHRDGNGLNNQRANIRPCTSSQNMANSNKQPNTQSRFKGVYLESGRWRSVIGLGGKRVSLGYFDDQKSAALAYDSAARENFGEFARLNFNLA